MTADKTELAGTIVVGSLDADHIELRVPQFVDESGWFHVLASVRSGDFTGRTTTTFDGDALPRLRSALERLHGDLVGAAALHTHDPGVELHLAGDRTGVIHVRGTLRAASGLGCTLEFVLPDIDQSYLPHLIRSIDAIVGSLDKLRRV